MVINHISVDPSWDDPWVTKAFSVNQHASICGGYGPEPPENTPEWKAWDKKRWGNFGVGVYNPRCDLRPTPKGKDKRPTKKGLQS